MASLSRQTVLITGCTSGIGAQLALEFTRRGHRVFAGARDEESAGTLRAQGFESYVLDVTDREAFRQTVGRVIERAGRVDMLINNAGFLLAGPVAEVALEDVRRQFEVNLLGAICGIQAVVPHMAERRCGRIVNMGSPSGVLVSPFAGIYSASKAALHCISEALRVEVAPLGIDVIIVQPGAVKSSLAENAGPYLGRYRRPDSLYGALAGSIERRVSFSQRRPLKTEVFARRMVAAVTRKRPPRVVRIGKEAHLFPIFRAVVPDWLLDKVMSAIFEVKKLDERT